MRYLLLSSCLYLLASCTPVYKSLRPASGDINYIQKFRPRFTVALYKTEVDVIGRHLSGMLLIKTLPDSSVRMVFSNEMGFKFFDFEFSQNGSFKTYYVVKQMDKGPVIKTLRKDFELIMIHTPAINTAGYLRKDDSSLYYIFPQQKGFYCYVTDAAGSSITRAEIASPHKPIVQAIMQDFKNGLPDTIGITHKNFNFTIALKRIEK